MHLFYLSFSAPRFRLSRDIFVDFITTFLTFWIYSLECLKVDRFSIRLLVIGNVKSLVDIWKREESLSAVDA